MLYMVTFTINIPPMLAYIPYMDPMGYKLWFTSWWSTYPSEKYEFVNWDHSSQYMEIWKK